MHLLVTPTMCQVTGTTEERHWLWRSLRIKDPTCRFATAYKQGRWDGYVNFYHRKGFPTGLLPWTLRRARTEGVSIELPACPRPAWTNAALPAGLRTYQHHAVRHALHHTLRSTYWYPRGIVVIPTAGGKTLVLTTLAALIPDPVLILTHRATIFSQLLTACAQTLPEPIGALGHGTWQEHGRVVVAMVQTLAPLLGRTPTPFLQQFGAVLVDEAHHAKARTWERVLRQTTQAAIRIGVTATPYKRRDALHRWRTVAYLGPVLARESVGDLTTQGYLAPVRYVVKTLHHPGLLGVSYEEARAQAITTNPERDRIIHRYVATCQRQREAVLVLVRHLPHGHRLAALLQAPFLHGGTEAAERTVMLAHLSQGGVLVGTLGALGEGTNVPTLHRVVLAGGGKSEIEFTQAVGRGMRQPPGQHAQLIVLDFFDAGSEYLTEHSQARVALARQLGFHVHTLDQGEGPHG